jgi:predicted ATP-grasp superfamily ATP-dependent carboligase
MKIQLSTSIPTNPLIVLGIPSVGMIGTIVTEFLIEHTAANKVGRCLIDDTNPIVAIHKGEVIDPIGLFYSQKNHMLFVHVATNLEKYEWAFAKTIYELATQLGAQKIINVEGIVDNNSEQPAVYTFTKNLEQKRRLSESHILFLEEGIVMGSVASLLQLDEEQKSVSFFATTHSQLPDSVGAAQVILALDAFLQLSIDPKPLLEQAAVYEAKIKEVLGGALQSSQEKKSMSYVG